MNRPHRASRDPATDQRFRTAPYDRSPLDESLLLRLVHRQIQGEGRLSVPWLAERMEVPEESVLYALADLRSRGWIELVPKAPYFRITPAGHGAR